MTSLFSQPIPSQLPLFLPLAIAEARRRVESLDDERFSLMAEAMHLSDRYCDLVEEFPSGTRSDRMQGTVDEIFFEILDVQDRAAAVEACMEAASADLEDLLQLAAEALTPSTVAA